MTLKELQTLSNEELDKKLATLLNWKPVRGSWVSNYGPGGDNGEYEWSVQPFYSTQLETMHCELLKLNKAQQAAYYRATYHVLGGKDLPLVEYNWKYHNATARQRAEALVMALEKVDIVNKV
jgi:hypothetical protein